MARYARGSPRFTCGEPKRRKSKFVGSRMSDPPEMLERRTARERYRFLPWIGILLVLPLAAGSVAIVIEATLEIAAGHLVNAGQVHLLLLPLAFALPLGLRLAGARVRTIGASSAPDRRPSLMSYALVSIPPLLSLPSTVDAIWRLLR